MRYKDVVQKGKKKATALGFPTINIPFAGNVAGIYAATIYFGEHTYFAVAYVNTSRKVLEAHLLDFSEDLYGKKVEIELVHKIRDDKRFEKEADLKAAIAKDVQAVREYFGL